MVRGRSFTATDVGGAVPVAIVNETFARAYFPEGDALGQRVDLGRVGARNRYPSLKGPGVVIVGVAADVRDVSFRNAVRRTMYLPQAQAPDIIANIRPAMPGPRVFPLSETVADSLARERFGTILVSLFGALALILTAVGVSSLLAQAVRARRREIGIRMAVGASGDAILRWIVVRGLLPVAIGIGVGLVGAAALSGLLRAYLWGVTGTDAATLGAAAAGMLGVAILACWIPAREAARTDPARALSSS